MQLIIETERTLHIKENMSTLKESLDIVPNGIIEVLNIEACNANNECSQCQDNIVHSGEEIMRVRDVKVQDEAILPETTINTHYGALENNDEEQNFDNNAITKKSSAENVQNGVSNKGHGIENTEANESHSENIILEKEVSNEKSTKTEGEDNCAKTEDVTSAEIDELALIREELKDILTKDVTETSTQKKQHVIAEESNTPLSQKKDVSIEVSNKAPTHEHSVVNVQKETKNVNVETQQEVPFIMGKETEENVNMETEQEEAASTRVEIDEVCLEKAENINMETEQQEVATVEAEMDDDCIEEAENDSMEPEHEEVASVTSETDHVCIEEDEENVNWKTKHGKVDLMKTKMQDVCKDKIIIEENHLETGNTVAQQEKDNEVTDMVPNTGSTESSDITKKVDENASLNKLMECEANIEIMPDINTEQGETSEVPKQKMYKSSELIDSNAKGEVCIKSEDATKEDKEEILDVDEIQVSEQNKTVEHKTKEKSPENLVISSPPVICKLSNTLDILSDDDEDEPTKVETPNIADTASADKQCINIEDDDDIMLIDEDTNSKDSKSETIKIESSNDRAGCPPDSDGVKIDLETGEKKTNFTDTVELSPNSNEKESTPLEIETTDPNAQLQMNEKTLEHQSETIENKKPLLPRNFLKSVKKNLADMTRDDLEEFCILKIVESIVDRSNLSEIKTKLKTVSQNIDEYRKKAMMLTKQNRDLQVVLKSVQEEQKKMPTDAPITPLKITRSVGMQVLMNDIKPGARRKGPPSVQSSNIIPTRPIRNATIPSPRPQKPPGATQNIPVPRLVPANNPATKTPNTTQAVTNVGKTATPVQNGLKNPLPVQKVPEKRPINRVQSVTVDLTDDEPPAKITPKCSPVPPVRLVPSQNLLAPQRQQFGQSVNSPRKVYIPISGPQGQNIRAGQTIMLKSMPNPGPRQRCAPPAMPRMQQNQVRMNRGQGNRHPAPLPDCMKQYQPPTWKALPPPPDLKLSKVENGIVISWKIEGYQEDSYEEIASYQLYAYQETSSPPSTALWKKIGDVKALPLPMACTLTQFMAGFKYYFAVRPVDIRSRLGPFSLPGSILLLNKM